MVPHSGHQCLIYSGAPSRHLPAIAFLLGQKLKENQRCLYMNSPSLVAGMKSQLAADGVDVHREISRGALVLSSEQHHLSGGWEFDTTMMMEMLERGLEQALKDGYLGLWATGDMAWEFGLERDFTKLLEYEWRLEEFIREHPQMGGICQYHTDTLPREALRKGLTAHSKLFVNQTLSIINEKFLRRGSVTPPVAACTDLDQFIDSVLAQTTMSLAAPLPSSGI